MVVMIIGRKPNLHDNELKLTLISTEIKRVRESLFQIDGNEKKPLILPDPEGPIIQKQEKVYVPVKEHPDVST